MITVTKPYMPPLREFLPYLEKIWASSQLTNNGPFHKQLEIELAEYLGVKYISLFANATLGLVTALQAMRISGEVITTPFSFVATTHALWWNKITPVFVDVESEYLNLDPAKIEAAITPRTSAIMPVHVYGNPCNVEEIKRIADKHGLKVIYDAAHAFGVRQNDDSVLNHGDLSVVSFHATKVYSTIEGGAVICHDPETKHHLDNLKNFGFRDETIVEEPGINAKLNEVQAAYGLLQLKYIDDLISKRKLISRMYHELLHNVPGIRLFPEIPGVRHGYAYFPVLVEKEKYGINRDDLYEKLKQNKIFTRRYFYPLISTFEPYSGLPSAKAENLPVAVKAANDVLCLPIYAGLEDSDVRLICSLIKEHV